MTHLLHVWFQQRLDGQKGKRRDIKEIKDFEPKYLNLQYYSDEIKSINCKISQHPVNHYLTPPVRPPPKILEYSKDSIHKDKKDLCIFPHVI